MVDWKCGNFKVNVEIVTALVFFAFMFSDALSANLLIFRTCYAYLGYNMSDCAKLGTENPDNATQALEKIVEPYVNVISMTSSLLEQLTSSALCLFIGPWSDKNGRKPIMLAVLSGILVGYLIKAVVAYLTYANPWFFILASVPVILTGGFSSLLTAILCYITDTTEETDRGLRMGLFQAAIVGGMVGGTFSSSYALKAVGYVVIYLIGATILGLAITMTVFRVPESVVIEENRDKKLFNITRIKEVVYTTTKRRENYDRALLLILIMILVFYSLYYTSDGNINFMYLRSKFDWTVRKYTLVQSAKGVMGVVGSFLGVYVLHKLLRIPEATLLIVGFTASIVACFVIIFAQNDTQIYIAGAIQSFSGIISPMLRSLISKLIPSEELGKIFALSVVLETLMGVIGAPLYTFVYNKTISTFPGAYNFVTIGIFCWNVILTIILIIMKKFSASYQSLQEDTNAIAT